MKNIHSIRTDYVKREMRIQDLEDSPAQQLSIWINEAIKSNVPDANAFCLSTVTSDGFPKGRMVLVRAIEGESVVFYTNKNSNKGKDFRSNAKAGATFFWAEMERQACLTGVVTEISEEENHHPDILFGWGYAKIMITTHAIEGLSENDFILAAKIDQIFNV